MNLCKHAAAPLDREESMMQMLQEDKHGKATLDPLGQALYAMKDAGPRLQRARPQSGECSLCMHVSARMLSSC